MKILILESSLDSIQVYSNYLLEYLQRKGFKARIIQLGEVIPLSSDFLIVEGSIFSHQGESISVESNLVFGDYFFLFKSAELSNLPFKNMGINIFEIKDKNYKLSMMKVIESIVQREKCI